MEIKQCNFTSLNGEYQMHTEEVFCMGCSEHQCDAEKQDACCPLWHPVKRSADTWQTLEEVGMHKMH